MTCMVCIDLLGQIWGINRHWNSRHWLMQTEVSMYIQSVLHELSSNDYDCACYRTWDNVLPFLIKLYNHTNYVRKIILGVVQNRHGNFVL